MVDLPGNIIDEIIDYLDEPLAGYATISTSWQQCIERRTFKELKVSSDGDDLALFQEYVMHRHHRQEVLRNIEYNIILPYVSDKRIRKLVSRREAAANNAAFTAAVAKFFPALATLSPDITAPLALRLFPESPRNPTIERDSPEKHYGDRMWTIRDIYGHPLEFDLSQITLPLPTVGRITVFEIWSTKKIHPSCYPPLLLAMPGIQELEMMASLPRRRQMALRPPTREALGDALNSIVLPSITKFTLDFQEGDPGNEAFEPGLLLDSPDAPDTVSMGLARISRLPTLRKMLVIGDVAITPALFQPVVSNQEQDVPGLRGCEFYIGAVTPQGQWLFSRSANGLGSNEADEHESEFTDDEMVETPPPFDSEDSDTSDFAPHKAWDRENGEIPYIQFRSTPDWSLFSPIITVLTRCVTDYPNLEIFTVHIGTKNVLRIEYYGAGIAYDREDEIYNVNVHLPRWYIFFQENHDSGWEIPTQWLDALYSTVEKGCVLVHRNNEETVL